jgi:hypothetical protein
LNKDDLKRFMVSDAILYDKSSEPIKTIVVYSGAIEKAKTSLDCGSIKYEVQPFYLAKLDGDASYAGLRGKIAAGEKLTKQDIMSIVFLPLEKQGTVHSQYPAQSKSCSFARFCKSCRRQNASKTHFACIFVTIHSEAVNCNERIPMEYPEQHKSRIAFLFVREKKDGTVRQSHLTIIILVAVAVAAILVLAALVLLVVYLSKTVSIGGADVEEDNRDTIIANLQAQITNLKNEIDNLDGINKGLGNENTRLKLLEEIREEELVESRRPTGFPMGSSGRTTLEEHEEDILTMYFNSDEGNTVISVGAGVVEAVVTDSEFGTRIIIDHQNGYKSVYTNNGQALVRVGDELGRRYILFLIGADNKTLVFQIYEGEEQIDPMDIMEIAG